MSFLAPLFLAAIAAVSLPVLLHLIRRTPRGRVLFSSLMFLSSSPPRVTKRSRLEHWLLLLMRALAVCLLALAFARPFVWEQSAAEAEQTGPGRRIAILIDTSASMKRDDLWAQAKRAAQDALAEAKPTDSITLMSFDRRASRAVSLQQWAATPIAQRSALMSDALSHLSPGWASTKLGDALAAAADALNETESGESAKSFTGERQIVLISDMQAGSDLGSLGAYDWPAEVTAKVMRVESKRATNAGLQIVADRENAAEQGGTLRLRISNASDSAREKFTVKFDPPSSNLTAAPSSIEAYVPPGESRIIRTPELPSWWSPAGNSVTLEGDDHDFDNRAFHIAQQPREAIVVYIGTADAKDTKDLLYYLHGAYLPTARLAPKIVTVKPDQPLPPGETDGASLFIIGESVPADRIASLRKRIEKGATALVVLRDAAMSETLAGLLDVKQIGVTEAVVKEYAMLTEIDFKHPLFTQFAEPRYSDFTKVRFWKHRTLDLSMFQGARTLAKFDAGSPALVEAPLGKGTCLVFAAGWHPADGQFALSSKFLPLMNVLLQQSLGEPPREGRLEVGEVIDLSWLSRSPMHRGKAVKVTGPGPGAKSIALDDKQRVTQTDEPGVYTAIVGDNALPFAVNVAASESDTTPLATDELEKRGVKLWQSSEPYAAAEAERHRQMRMTEMENKHKIWRWLIVAAIGMLIAETWLAGWFSRIGSGQETAT